LGKRVWWGPVHEVYLFVEVRSHDEIKKLTKLAKGRGKTLWKKGGAANFNGGRGGRRGDCNNLKKT